MELDDAPTVIDVMDKIYVDWGTANGEIQSSNILLRGASFGAGLAKGLILGGDKTDEFSDTLVLACAIFMFLRTILDTEHLLTHHLDSEMLSIGSFRDKQDWTVKALFAESEWFLPLSKKVASIEVAREGRIERLYFRVPEMCTANLSEGHEGKADSLRGSTG